MMNAKPLRLFLGFGIVLIPVVCSAADAISFSTLVTNMPWTRCERAQG